jgi:hypothetical protein
MTARVPQTRSLFEKCAKEKTGSPKVSYCQYRGVAGLRQANVVIC